MRCACEATSAARSSICSSTSRLLGARNLETALATTALGLARACLRLRLLHVVQTSELVEGGGHVAAVDSEGALEVLLRALEVVLAVLVRFLTAALHLKGRDAHESFSVLELRVTHHLGQGARTAVSTSFDFA